LPAPTSSPCTTPLTDKTRNIVDASAIAKMKTGVRIINCARGGLIVEADLIAALKSGKVAGAGIDVFEVEPAEQNALFGMENVVATPHLGASTTEAQENVALQVAEQMADYLIKGAVSNAHQHAVDHRRGGATAETFRQARRSARRFCRPGSPRTRSRKSRYWFDGSTATMNTRALIALPSPADPPQVADVNMVSAPIR